MYAEVASSYPQVARLRPPSPALPPHRRRRLLVRHGEAALEDEDLAALVPNEHLDIEAARTAAVTRGPVLRPATDRCGRTVILVYLPDSRPAPECMQTCEVVLVSMLQFGDDLRRTARALGMGNLAARVSQALVETGSLRRASRSLEISHLTAASEMRDALHAAGVHSQAGLIARLSGTWLSEPLYSERTIGLIMETFRLRRRDATVAALRASGLTRPEAAAELGISQWAMAESSANVFRTLGVTKAPELSRIVADLMLAADLAERHQG